MYKTDLYVLLRRNTFKRSIFRLHIFSIIILNKRSNFNIIILYFDMIIFGKFGAFSTRRTHSLIGEACDILTRSYSHILFERTVEGTQVVEAALIRRLRNRRVVIKSLLRLLYSEGRQKIGEAHRRNLSEYA